jgi:glycosyltransferase involved in cell wall biosynthesis/SAM-dependent methyltransferase
MSSDHLVVFSPVPPSRSGIADYFFEQIPFIEPRAHLTVVVDDDQDLSMVNERHPSLDVRRITDWDSHPEPGALLLHHLGNNPDHAFVRRALTRYSGVVVLHDLIQHHLVGEMTLARGDEEGYRKLMVDELGPIGSILAEDRGFGMFSEFQQFMVPLNRDVIAAARGVIVHSRWARRAVEELGTGVPATTVPHHFSRPRGGDVGRAEARRQLGIPEAQLVIVTLGYITPPKQAGLLLRALSNLKGQLPPYHLYLVGEPHDEAYWSDEIGRCGLTGQVTITGYVPLEDLVRYAEAADVVVNLRYPSAGETSGTLVRALGVGAPCIVFDYGPFSDYPDDAVCKVPLATDDTGPLGQALAQLLADPEWRARLSTRAQHYVAARHQIGACVGQYLAFVRRCGVEQRSTGMTQRAWSNAGLLEQRLDGASLLAIVEHAVGRISHPGLRGYYTEGGHCRRLATTLAYVPVAEGDMRALEIGSYEIVVPCLRHVLQYREVFGTIHDPTRPIGPTTELFEWNGEKEEYPVSNGDLEFHPLSFPSQSMDLVVCGEVIEHMSRDPMRLLAEVNRVLKPGGLLVLTTPNITSLWSLERLLMGHWPYLYPVYSRAGSTDRHNIEYSPSELQLLLEAAGFTVRLATHNSWTTSPPFAAGLVSRAGYSQVLRDDNIFALGVKVSRVIERYPVPSYEGGAEELRWSDDVAAVQGGPDWTGPGPPV